MPKVPTLRLIVNENYDNVGTEFHRTVSLWRELGRVALQYVIGGIAFLSLVWALANAMLSMGVR